jgi:hypothetical protein
VTIRFERLPGLPGTGPLPEQFSATGRGTHSEGLVVRFESQEGTPWVGNFQRALSSYDAVLRHPDGEHIIVIAGGQGYLIDADTRRAIGLFGAAIVQAHNVESLGLLVLDHQGVAFEAIGRQGRSWHTRRLSWDGFRKVEIGGTRMVGEAWNPMDKLWHAFVVNLKSGASSGGSYHWHDADECERLSTSSSTS